MQIINHILDREVALPANHMNLMKQVWLRTVTATYFHFDQWSSWTSCVVHSPQMRKSHLCPTRSVSPTASYGKTNFSSVKKLFSYL
jgi:hypothetical protein